MIRVSPFRDEILRPMTRAIVSLTEEMKRVKENAPRFRK